jgi:hypothetical protein
LNIRPYFTLIAGCILSFLGGTTHLNAQTAGSTAIVFPGEELTYEVSWMSVKLGQIRLRMLEPRSDSNGIRYQAEAHVDSYTGIPFIDLHVVDCTEMDKEFFSQGFHSTERKDDKRWLSETSHYNFPQKLLVVEKCYRQGKDSAPSTPAWFDTVALPSTQV